VLVQRSIPVRVLCCGYTHIFGCWFFSHQDTGSAEVVFYCDCYKSVPLSMNNSKKVIKRFEVSA
jgi:hypothetical protein